ncbi:MAG TPA: hypothetical protein VGD50_05610, partial [Candidatus Baltobacteraceae bacterium]
MPYPHFGQVTTSGFPTDPAGSDPQNMGGSVALFYLALDGYMSCGSDAAALQGAILSLENVMKPGNAPEAAEPLYYWSEGPISAAIALLLKTPGDPLAAAGGKVKANATLLLNALALGANGNYSDANDYATDIGKIERGDASAPTPGNATTSVRSWSHTHNPNYLGGIITIIACSIAYGPSGCNAVFSGFNFATYDAAITSNGWTGMHNAWNNNKAQFSAAVIKPWALAGHSTADLNGMFEALAYQGWGAPTYSSTQIAPSDLSCNNAGIDTQGVVDPVAGLPGQIGEFASTDSDGCRSDALYAFEAISHTIYGAALLKATKNWAPLSNTATYMHNGGTDLFFKIDNGYSSWGLGRARDVWPDKPTDPALWPGAPASDL